jgi:Flp pilus assembly protein TadG
MGARSILSRLFRSRSGNVVVETAMLAPIAMAMLVVLTDFGRNLYTASALENAAHAGIYYAMHYPGDYGGMAAAVRKAGGVADNAVIASEAYCECPNGVRVACTGTCDSGKVIWLVSVSVTQSFNTIIPYPGVIMPTQLVGSAVLRVR